MACSTHNRGRRHHVFNVALSRSKLGGSGLVRECSISATAYASDVPAYSRTSPLLQKNRVSSVSYRLFDKRRLAGDLPETGSSTDTRGVSDTTWGRCAAHRCRRNLRELPRPPGRSRLTCTSINYRMFDKRRRFISGFYWVPHGSNKLTSTPPSTFPMCISPACNCTTSSTKFSPSPVLFRPLSGRGRE